MAWRFARALTWGMVAAFLLSGCGASEQKSVPDGGPSPSASPAEDTRQEVQLGPNIVTDQDIGAQSKGSPDRALLEWWQAVQFQDEPSVFELSSSNVRSNFGTGRLRRLVRASGPALGGLEIVGATTRKDAATVRAAFVTYDADSREPSDTLPVSLTMLKEGDTWRFDDPRYLRALAKGYGVR